MKRIKSLFIIFSFVILFVVFYFLKFEWLCPFKKYLGIRCPGCGLTRSILALLNFDLISSIKYNILGIPLVIIVIISTVLLIKDFVKNEDKFITLFYKVMNKYWIILLIIVAITMIINNVNLV